MSMCASRVILTVISLFPAAFLTRADVIVDTSIGLTSFMMSSSSGSIQFIAPLISPPGCTSNALCATAFAQAEDGFGGFGQQFNVADNGATSASAATPYANANSAASVPSLTASAGSGVTIALIDGSADSTARGTLVGTFQIVDTTDPVTLSFSAALNATQTLTTDTFGLLASSETTFNLILSNGDNPLFFDNPMTIGSDQSQSFISSPTLTGSSSLLSPNTPYSLVAEVDSESSGINSAVPEPSSSFLSVTVLGLCAMIVARRARQSHR